jgi:hypothetical protein
MPGNSNSINTGNVPGLTLVAWALITGTTLTKGFNVTSITHGATGQWTLVLTSAIASASVVLDGKLTNAPASGGPLSIASTGSTTTVITFRTETNAAVLADPSAFWVGVYL